MHTVTATYPNIPERIVHEGLTRRQAKLLARSIRNSGGSVRINADRRIYRKPRIKYQLLLIDDQTMVDDTKEIVFQTEDIHQLNR